MPISQGYTIDQMETKKRLKKVFLTTSKIQPTGRIALGPAAMTNLDVEVGDELDIFFDPETGSIIVSKKEGQWIDH